MKIDWDNWDEEEKEFSHSGIIELENRMIKNHNLIIVLVDKKYKDQFDEFRKKYSLKINDYDDAFYFIKKSHFSDSYEISYAYNNKESLKYIKTKYNYDYNEIIKII